MIEVKKRDAVKEAIANNGFKHDSMKSLMRSYGNITISSLITYIYEYFTDNYKNKYEAINHYIKFKRQIGLDLDSFAFVSNSEVYNNILNNETELEDLIEQLVIDYFTNKVKVKNYPVDIEDYHILMLSNSQKLFLKESIDKLDVESKQLLDKALINIKNNIVRNYDNVLKSSNTLNSDVVSSFNYREIKETIVKTILENMFSNSYESLKFLLEVSFIEFIKDEVELNIIYEIYDSILKEILHELKKYSENEKLNNIFKFISYIILNKLLDDSLIRSTKYISIKENN